MTRSVRVALAATVLFSLLVLAESKNPADYPLRIHIFGRNQTTFYHNRAVDETKGEGRANLFENGEPHALEFTYECPEKLMPSFGFETYPAKWKKPNQELVILVPVIGKSNAYFTCKIKTEMKDYAYVVVNGRLVSEQPARYKEWMLKHDYDPEHGKNVPDLQPKPASTPQQ